MAKKTNAQNAHVANMLKQGSTRKVKKKKRIGAARTSRKGNGSRNFY